MISMMEYQMRGGEHPNIRCSMYEHTHWKVKDTYEGIYIELFDNFLHLDREKAKQLIEMDIDKMYVSKCPSACSRCRLYKMPK